MLRHKNRTRSSQYISHAKVPCAYGACSVIQTHHDSAQLISMTQSCAVPRCPSVAVPVDGPFAVCDTNCDGIERNTTIRRAHARRPRKRIATAALGRRLRCGMELRWQHGMKSLGSSLETKMVRALLTAARMHAFAIPISPQDLLRVALFMHARACSPRPSSPAASSSSPPRSRDHTDSISSQWRMPHATANMAAPTT